MLPAEKSAVEYFKVHSTPAIGFPAVASVSGKEKEAPGVVEVLERLMLVPWPTAGQKSQKVASNVMEINGQAPKRRGFVTGLRSAISAPGKAAPRPCRVML
jgi:hypothetical protein